MKITITLPFTIVLTAVFLFDKTGLAVPAVLGILLHESGHLAAMAAAGIGISEINLRVGAVEIIKRPDHASRLKHAAVSVAGSAAGALAGAAFYIVYRISGSAAAANFAVMQICFAGFNMLPFRGLDGGELAFLFLPQTAVRILSGITVAIVFAAGLWLFFSCGGAGLALSAAYIGIMGLAFSKTD